MGLSNRVGVVLVLMLGFMFNDANVIPVFWVMAALSAASVFAALAFPKALMR